MASWPINVALQEDESLSSWLSRAALENGCDPLVLTGNVWPKWRVWTTDIDRGMSEERLLALEKASCINVQSFEAASLRPTGSLITSGPLDQLAVWPWVLALGQKNRKRLGGLQFCPACLSEDRKPYYRLRWRLAWHVGCPVHDVLLHDRCCHCDAPVQPHRLLAEDKHLAVCAVCKHDLRAASLVEPYAASYAFQEIADSVIRDGFGYYGQEELSSQEWFRLSRYFLHVLRRVALRPSDNLAVMVKRMGVTPTLPPITGLPLEMLTVGERAPLLAGCWMIINAGPDKFLESAVHASVTQATFAGVCRWVPKTILEVIASLPSGAVPRKEVDCGNTDALSSPRSKQAVMRMYARLQRKMAMRS